MGPNLPSYLAVNVQVSHFNMKPEKSNFLLFGKAINQYGYTLVLAMGSGLGIVTDPIMR